VLTDICVRGTLLSYFSKNQLIHYAISLLASFFGCLFIQLLLLKYKRKSALFYMLVIVSTAYMLLGVVLSASFYFFNGFFPNYYTLEYVKTEPKSAFILVRDSFSVVQILGLLLLCLSFIMFQKWLISKSLLIHFNRLLYVAAGIYVISLSYLTWRHKKYDQCYTLDTNLVTATLRHLTDIGKERTFSGHGLGYRHPLKLSFPYEKADFNVLIVLCESLRKQNIGIYGYSKNTTPQLDGFISKNKQDTYVFKFPFSVSSTTMLAVPAVLSGIAPYQNPEVFYRQPLIWDFAKKRGARTFFISSHTMEWYHFDRYYANEKLDYFWCKETSGKPFFNDLGIDDRYTIEELKNQLAVTKKTFLGVVQLNATHYPYNVPQHAEKWKGTFEDAYNNAIRYQDSLLGMVFKQLEESGQLHRTVIIFTSDHGESLKDHHLIGHVDSYYNEAISIPLIVYLPKNVGKNLNRNTLNNNKSKTVSTIDIAPTLLTLYGLKKQHNISEIAKQYTGYDLFSNIPRNRNVITMNNSSLANFKVGASVVGNGWHYLHRMNCVPYREELYFTKWDKKEQFNLIGKKGQNQRIHFLNELKKYPICKPYLPMK
jgi:glucan phosphoethanolaminetransferase (alkaline phosphatase superfamily)